MCICECVCYVWCVCVCCMVCVCVDGGMKGVEQVSFVKHFQCWNGKSLTLYTHLQLLILISLDPPNIIWDTWSSYSLDNHERKLEISLAVREDSPNGWNYFLQVWTVCRQPQTGVHCLCSMTAKRSLHMYLCVSVCMLHVCVCACACVWVCGCVDWGRPC